MIYKKLKEIQDMRLSVIKNKTNPHFKNGYPDLNAVLDVVMPVLNEKNIVLTQCPQEEGLETTLYDTDDESKIVSLTPWTDRSNPQKLGGCITYYRRYSLVSMLNLEAEDDDGNTASATEFKSEVDDIIG